MGNIAAQESRVTTGFARVHFLRVKQIPVNGTVHLQNMLYVVHL